MAKFKQSIVRGHTVTYWEWKDDGGFMRVRARSRRHARRICRDLNWRSYDRGVGRSFAEVYYNGRYVCRRYGLDV